MGSCGGKPVEQEDNETSGIRTTRKKNKKRDTHKVVLVGDKAVGKSRYVDISKQGPRWVVVSFTMFNSCFGIFKAVYMNTFTHSHIHSF